MSRIILLDTGPLGFVTHPNDTGDIGLCKQWFEQLLAANVIVKVPQIVPPRQKSFCLAVRIRTQPGTDLLHRVERLLQALAESVPAETAHHGEWLDYAFRWAELTVARCQTNITERPELRQRWQALQEQMDRALHKWLEHRFAGLHNQPPVPPVMVHHIPRFIARVFGNTADGKAALFVMDGLALDQWAIVREVLSRQRPELLFRQSALFAWVPTITSVSRQALFAGKAPLFFPSSIHTTGREATLWSQFWADNGVGAAAVGYLRGLGEPADFTFIEELVTQPHCKMVGLVIDKVDKIMHGMELGTAGMHNQVRQWAEEGLLARLIDLLLNNGYALWLTADHGNVEAIGCGRPAEGALAEQRGERVRVFADPVLRARIQERFPNAVPWPALGLPDDFLPLLAPGRAAFVRAGERIVGHGGITLEEIVVPFIGIQRR